MQPKIAVLDDYQGVALKMADWSEVTARAQVDVFNDHLADTEAVATRLDPFDVVCAMRERTPLGAALIERLPNLKLIASTGPRNPSTYLKGAAARFIGAEHTGYIGTPIE